MYTIDKNSTIGFNPDLWCPSDIYVAQGNILKLYNDNLAYIPVTKKDRVTFRWIGSILTQDSYSCTIDTSIIGSYPIQLICTSYLNQKIATINFNVVVEEKKALGDKTILSIGDSQIYSGWQYMSLPINDSLDITATYIGTQKIDPYKNEGRSGWTTTQFVNVGSPFWIGGKLDFQAYLTNNSFVTPDIIKISLGLNDCFSLGNTNTMIANLQTLVNAIRADAPNAKIIVSTLSTASNTYWGWLASYKEHSKYENFILKVRELNEKITITFNDLKNANIYSDYCTLTVDRDNDYPKSDGKHTDALHLKSTGYPNLIKGNLNIINHIY